MNKISIKSLFPKEHKSIRVFIVAALILLAVGIFAPLFTANKYIFFSRTLSLYSMLLYFLAEKQYFFMLSMLGLGMLLPVVKLGAIAHVWHASFAGIEQAKKRMSFVSRFLSYFVLDVIFVGMLIYMILFQINARIEWQFGFYCYVISILIIFLMSLRMLLIRKRLFEKG